MYELIYSQSRNRFGQSRNYYFVQETNGTISKFHRSLLRNGQKGQQCAYKEGKKKRNRVKETLNLKQMRNIEILQVYAIFFFILKRLWC